MNLLLTGASGFIGSAILRQIDHQKFTTIHCVSHRSDPQRSLHDRVMWHRADLLHPEAIAELIDTIRPDTFIHAAWETTHDYFWSSEKNRDWLSASLTLLGHSILNHCRRFVFLGSMAEYDWSAMPLIEYASRDLPFTLYGETKLAFERALLQQAKQSGMLAASGRIFNLYGPNEHSGRLVPQIRDALAHARSIKVGSPDRIRDLMHVDDLARAILALHDSEIEGPVNLASGTPISMAELYRVIGKITGQESLIDIGARRDTHGEPKTISADAALIRSTGWRPLIRLEDGLRALWQNNAIAQAA